MLGSTGETGRPLDVNRKSVICVGNGTRIIFVQRKRFHGKCVAEILVIMSDPVGCTINTSSCHREGYKAMEFRL